MFSGIVNALGEIQEIQAPSEQDVTAKIGVCEGYTNFMSSVGIGDSIACSGVCLTVTDKTALSFTVNISNVTLHSTNLQFWKPGMKINLESSLKVGDPLHGHMVQGHVDGIGTVSSIARVAGSYILEISYPPSMAKYISRKGSISLDGVSLTVNSTENTSLKVNIVPYTWQNTSLQYREIGDKINIETDLVARYLETLLQQYNTTK